MIPAEAFALATGFFSAVNLILVKKGMARSNAITAIVVSLAINVIIFWSFVWMVVPREEIWRAELLIFVMVGLIQPGGTRFLSYLSVEKVGVTITAPLRATTPLFSSLLAILVLGENLTVPVAVGTLFVVSGIILISLKGKGTVVWRNIYIFLPIFSALVAGSTQVIRKMGLVHLPFPLLGGCRDNGDFTSRGDSFTDNLKEVVDAHVQSYVALVLYTWGHHRYTRRSECIHVASPLRSRDCRASRQS